MTKAVTTVYFHEVFSISSEASFFRQMFKISQYSMAEGAGLRSPKYVGAGR